MSTSESTSGPSRKELDQLHEELCQAAIKIITKFQDPRVPTFVGDFREVIFKVMHDAHVYKRQSLISDDDFNTLYHLWDILNDVEALIRSNKLNPEEVWNSKERN